MNCTALIVKNGKINQKTMILLKQKIHKARKQYDCMACDWLFNMGIRESGIKFTFSEYRSIIKAKQNNHKIQVGENYLYQFNVDGGDNWSFRAIPEIHKICLKYDLYLYY